MPLMRVISISKKVYKHLKRIPKEYAHRIDQAMLELRQNPFPHGSLKLEGSKDAYRIRVNDYRIVYRVTPETVTVYDVDHHKDIYR